MIVPGELERRFALHRPYVEQVAQRVRDTVGMFADTQGYAYAGRVKATESLAEKLESGRYSSWEKLDDLFASALVVPTLEYENDVVEFLRGKFDLVDVRRRTSSQKPPEAFRFDLTRVVARLPIGPELEAEAPLRKVLFEVQIRTAFEHAWCVTTHALAYKADEVDWRVLRLAAQLKAAVEQLDVLVLGFRDVSTRLSVSSWPDIDAKQRIEQSFRRKFETAVIPDEAQPCSWSRFCDNLLALIMAAQRNHVANRDKVPVVDIALSAIDAELDAMAPYPRSLSLMQFCAGALSRQGIIGAPLRDYSPVVSKDLLDLFPEARVLGEGFDFQFP